MNHNQHNSLINFIWSIADDVLRDVYTRGKYRDIILPFTVLRRLDAILEPTKDKVIEMHQRLNKMKIDNQAPQLRKVSGYVFYNTSPFTFKKLLNDPGNIRQNLENYLDGFSSDVQDIISKFKLRNQLTTMEEGNITFPLIEKYCSAQINLSPYPVKDQDKKIVLEGLSNLGMGYVFEELIRKFNEENNEEAGEHFTPREIIKLMTHLIFEPIKRKIKEGTYLIYDPACGSGGMLTEAENFATQLNPKAKFHLYGQEVNPETFAICKSDMLIKDKDPEKIAYGSTLSNDGFPRLQFDFMLSNPPYGKTWKIDQEAIVDGKKKEIIDSRFKAGVPRVSDGQLLFLMNMVSKMKKDSELGSRIASVHNGSSLFTGEAGTGESEIRRYFFENDLIEAVIQLPDEIFYNTGITTYLWIMTNRKSKERKGKIQLIDASNIFNKMRKGLGAKSNELKDEHIKQIEDSFIQFKSTDISKIFDNDDFAYRRIVVERPLRLSFQISKEKIASLGNAESLKNIVSSLQKTFGTGVQKNFNLLNPEIDKIVKAKDIKLKPQVRKAFIEAISWKDETAEKVVKKNDKYGIEYEPDTELRDYENIPLKQDIQEYFEKEVLPFFPDSWFDVTKAIKGYEIAFSKIFFSHHSHRNFDLIKEDILQLEKEAESIISKATITGIRNGAMLKSAGTVWLGDIPAHWDVKPFFYVFKEKFIKNDKKDEYNVLSLSYGKIVKRNLDNNYGLLPESFDGYQMVSSGDIIFRLTDMQNDHKSLRVGLSKLNGIITSAYLNIRPRISIDEDFAFYLLHAYDLSKIFYTLGGGVRQAIGFSEMKRIPILLPPIEEQKEIVRYIQGESAKMEIAIRRLEKEIELIKEYRQSIIAEVVTGKLDIGNAKSKEYKMPSTPLALAAED